jgi:hypothetical protein
MKIPLRNSACSLRNSAKLTVNHFAKSRKVNAKFREEVPNNDLTKDLKNNKIMKYNSCD